MFEICPRSYLLIVAHLHFIAHYLPQYFYQHLIVFDHQHLAV